MNANRKTLRIFFKSYARNIVKTIGVICVFFFWLSMATSPAQADGESGFPIRNIPAFADVRDELEILVNSDGFQKQNRFCVVGYGEGDSLSAMVYWPTENKLILWEPRVNDPRAILLSRRYLDLKRDVVPNDNDIDGSTYILSQSEVNGYLQDCRKHGNVYTIKKSESGWVSIDNFTQFSNARRQLQSLVDTNGHHKTNQFCVIGQRDGTYLAAYVYWPTENKLILWYPDPDDAELPLADSLGYVDLKNAVKIERPYNPYIYQMPRDFADNVIRACKKMGKNFVIVQSNGMGNHDE